MLNCVQCSKLFTTLWCRLYLYIHVTYFAYKYENKKSVLNKFTWILQSKTHIRNTNLLTAARNFVVLKWRVDSCQNREL